LAMYSFVLLFSTVLICYYDLKHLIIPDFINLILLGFGIYRAIAENNLISAVYGFFLGGLIMLFLALLGDLGGGDIKLVASLGVWFGRHSIDMIMFSFLIGFIWGGIHFLKHKSRCFPFGPSIMLAALLLWFFEIDILHLYYLLMMIWRG
jgi:leader peptidase (prepilin peptidase)/N-methyltransferase